MKEILRLLGIVRSYQWWMLLAAILGFATIGSGIGLLVSSGYIISKAALHPAINELQLGIAGVRLFGFARGILRYLERLVSHSTTFRILSRLRIWFYQSIEPLSPARLLEYRSGDLLQRITGDIDSLENLYSRIIAPPLTALMISALTWLLMGMFSPLFSFLIFAFHACAAIGLPLLAGYLNRGTAKKMTATRNELQSMTLDCIQGISDLTLFGRLEEHTGKLYRLKAEELRLQRKQAVIQRAHEPITGLLMNGAVLSFLWLLTPGNTNGPIEGVYIAVIIIAVMASFEAFLPLPDAVQHIEADAAAGKRLFEIVDTRPAVTAPKQPAPFPLNHAISFENVSFAYPGTDAAALSAINIKAEHGKTIAIVGPSGAGKSTITNLLLRFWNPDKGRITIGGFDIGKLDPESLRQHIGVVSQKTYLFGETVRENLLLARPDANDADLKTALERAGLGTFKNKLEQWVGQHGMSLSGGERQRIAIARMLLQDAPIVLLDEATANLDALTEQQVMQSILQFCSDKTLLVITHRLRNMERYDRIIVLSKGSIIEEGTHDDLLGQKGFYASMWSLQQSDTSGLFEHD